MSTQFNNIFRHGKDLNLNELSGIKFTDAIFPDGTQLKDVTFSQLSSTSWTNQSRNSVVLSLKPPSDLTISGFDTGGFDVSGFDSATDQRSTQWPLKTRN